MNSAAELRRHTENLALEKSIKAVSDALDKEPFGLDISQLMTVCRLSVKTTKNVLSTIDAYCEDGIWFLSAKRKQESEASLKLSTPAALVTLEPEEVIMPTNEDQSKNESLLKRMVKLFKLNPKGITLLDALDELNCQRSRFDTELNYVRKNYFPVCLSKQEDGRKLYIPNFDADQKSQEKPKTLPVNDTKPQDTSSEVVQKPEITPKNIPVANQKLPVETTEQVGVVNHLKALTKTYVTTKQELFLTQEQVSELLKQCFGLDEIKWTVLDDSHVVSIALSKTESTAVIKEA